LQDAHILGHLLANPNANLDKVEDILRIYQEIRLPLGAQAAERSRINGLIYEFDHPDFPVAENASVADLEIMGEAVGTSFAWLAEGSCDDDLKRAEAMFAAISNT
jgi:salicylate hydroxylase